MPPAARVTAVVHGFVQAVGFRWWTREQARRLGVAGSATNLPDGSVEVVVEGDRDRCEQMVALLRSGRTPGQVDRVDLHWGRPTGVTGFSLG